MVESYRTLQNGIRQRSGIDKVKESLCVPDGSPPCAPAFFTNANEVLSLYDFYANANFFGLALMRFSFFLSYHTCQLSVI